MNDPLFEIKGKTISNDSLEKLEKELKKLDSKLNLYYQLELDGTFCIGVLNCPCPQHYKAIKKLVDKYVKDEAPKPEIDAQRIVDVLKNKKIL